MWGIPPNNIAEFSISNLILLLLRYGSPADLKVLSGLTWIGQTVLFFSQYHYKMWKLQHDLDTAELFLPLSLFYITEDF